MAPSQHIEKLIADQARRISDLEAALRKVVETFATAFDQPDPRKTLGEWREEMLDALKGARATLDKS